MVGSATMISEPGTLRVFDTEQERSTLDREERTAAGSFMPTELANSKWNCSRVPRALQVTLLDAVSETGWQDSKALISGCNSLIANAPTCDRERRDDEVRSAPLRSWPRICHSYSLLLEFHRENLLIIRPSPIRPSPPEAHP